MELVNIGFGSLVSAGRLIAVVSPDSAPVKRLVSEARERSMLIDATFGSRAICRSLHLEPTVLASRLSSWMRKSSFLPTLTSLCSISRSWLTWLRRRTVSSSTATLSAKMAASVRMRASSMDVLWSASRILESSFSRYSATVWGERASTSWVNASMASSRCIVKLPRAYIFAEEAMKGLVQKRVSRGKVDVFVTVAALGAEETVVAVNEALCAAMPRSLRLMAMRTRWKAGSVPAFCC